MSTVDFSFLIPLLAGATLTLIAQRLHRYLIDRWGLGEPTWAEACEVYEQRRHHPTVVAVRLSHSGVYDHERDA